MHQLEQEGAREERRGGAHDDARGLQLPAHIVHLRMAVHHTIQQAMDKTGGTRVFAAQTQIADARLFQHATNLVDSTMGVGGQ